MYLCILKLIFKKICKKYVLTASFLHWNISSTRAETLPIIFTIVPQVLDHNKCSINFYLMNNHLHTSHGFVRIKIIRKILKILKGNLK